MPAIKSLPISSRFGMLTTIGESFSVYTGGGRRRMVVCRCDCGKATVCGTSNLRRGNTSSCGCMWLPAITEAHTKHGKSHEPLYKIWKSMRNRCLSKKSSGHKRYGGRGIEICAEWVSDYLAFREWATASGYRGGLSIERRNIDLGYSPDNCTWIEFSEQALNTSRNRFIEAFGERKPLAAWARDKRCVATRLSLRHRLEIGWDAEKAITTPTAKRLFRPRARPAA